MFETLKTSLFSYFFWNFRQYSYRLLYKEEGKEEAYYKNGKLVVFVYDTELGEKIYELVKALQENEKVIINHHMRFQISSYYTDEQNRVKAFSAYVDWKDEYANWEDLSSLQKLQEVVEFAENMYEQYGYAINSSKFQKETFQQVAAFLSCFDINAEGHNSSKGCLIEYIHYMLDDKNTLQERYQMWTQKETIEVNAFPYKLPLIKMCYNYFVAGTVPSSIYGVLTQEESAPEQSIYHIVNENILKAKEQVTEATKDYTVYAGNIKIYRNMPKGFAEFLEKYYRENMMPSTVEQISQILVDFEGKVVGYFFRNDTINYGQRKAILREVNDAFDIIVEMSNINSFLLDLRNQIANNQKGIEGNFNVERDVENGIGFKVRTVWELFNLVHSDVEFLKTHVTWTFLKWYAMFLNKKYGEMSEKKQILEKWEVRNLSPYLADAVIDFVLKRQVNIYTATQDFNNYNFIWYYDHYFYDVNLEYDPKKVPFFFDYEAEEKYGIKLKKGTTVHLPDGRRLEVLKQATNITRLKDRMEILEKEYWRKINLSAFELVTISEVIYSTKKNSNNRYSVVGYVTTPMRGKLLTKEVILGLNNRQIYELIGKLFAKFRVYYIQLGSIWMTDDFEITIDLLSKNFEIEKINEQEDKWYIKYLEQIGYPSKAFYGLSVRNPGDWQSLAQNCTQYCEEHGLYYMARVDLCPICQATKAVIRRMPRHVIQEDLTGTHYWLNDNVNLKLYRKDCKDREELERNVSAMVEMGLNDRSINVGQQCFVPYKKALNGKKQFIGYLYKEPQKEELDQCMDIGRTDELTNLPRLKSLIRLASQVMQLTDAGWSFTQNPFVHSYPSGEESPMGHVFLSKNHKKQVQILNIDLLSRNGQKDETIRWTCNYICTVLALDDTLRINTSDCENDLEQILFRMQVLASSLTKYCTVHHSYYSKHKLFCPKCISEEEVHNIAIEEVEKEEITQRPPFGEGGESIIYSYGADCVAKVFREGVVDQNFKNSVLIRVMKKTELLEEIDSQNRRYEFVIPRKLLVDQKTNSVFGYVMRKVSGKPLSNLRDQKEVENLGFTRKDVLEILIAVGEGIEALHQQGIFIGDLNGRNILFNENKIVYFLEFDGMGIDEIKPMFCTDGYIDPKSKKTQNITMKDDWYSYAVQAFYYLTYTHPFNGIYTERINGKQVQLDIPDKMEKRISLLGNHGMKQPIIAQPWDWMDAKLQEAFYNIFEKESRQSILSYLKEECQKEEEKEGGRVNDKFVATRIESFENQHKMRMINERTAVRYAEGDYLLEIVGEDNVFDVLQARWALNDLEYRLLKDILFLEDKETVWAVFTDKINGINLKEKKIFYQEELSQGYIRFSVVNENTLYFVQVTSEGDFIEKRSITPSGEVVKEKISFLPDKVTKGFSVQFNSKFVVVKQGKDGEDEIYCNNQKLCTMPDLGNLDYNIMYDEFSKGWLVLNCEGRAVVINADGTYQQITIPRDMWKMQYMNVSYIRRTIYIPDEKLLHMIKVEKDRVITKTMECQRIMTLKSKVCKVTQAGFYVLTKRALYEVHRG